MKSRLLIFAMLIGLISCNQSGNQRQTKLDLNVIDLTSEEIPGSIEIKGDLLISKSWVDKNGENLLIVSRKGAIKEAEYKDEFPYCVRYAELFGEQYVKQGDNYRLLWNIYDAERNCPLDLWIGLLPNSTQITDLDRDGITETTLIYQSTCKSDVSPSKMNLLIHENDMQMGLRGLRIVRPQSDKIDAAFEPDLSKIDTVGIEDSDKYLVFYGRYENENDFKGQPQEFLKYAKDLWIKFMKEDEFFQL